MKQSSAAGALRHCAASHSSASGATGAFKFSPLSTITEEQGASSALDEEEGEDDEENGSRNDVFDECDAHDKMRVAPKRSASESAMVDNNDGRRVRQRWNPYTQPLWASPANFAAAFGMVVAPNHEFRLPLVA